LQNILIDEEEFEDEEEEVSQDTSGSPNLLGIPYSSSRPKRKSPYIGLSDKRRQSANR